jgi:hypothetical protein
MWHADGTADGGCAASRLLERPLDALGRLMSSAGAEAATPSGARESGAVRADAQRRRSDTADQAAARHANPVAMAPATGAKSPATGTIVPSLPTTMVGA